MDYKVVRTSDYNDELYHWGTKKNHKYVARVKVKNGKYRYFYTKEEYNRYLKGKEFSNKIKREFKKAGNAVERAVEKGLRPLKKLTAEVKKKVTKLIDKVRKSKVSEMTDKIDKGFEYLVDKFDKNKNDANKKPLYIAKVKLPTGKYRYFYSQKAYNTYLKRLEYQKNEPDFMKNIPETPVGSIKTDDEEMAEINERYNPFNILFDAKREMNCMYCTTAYELRQRGYDVEAADFNPENYQGDLWSPKDWYEGGEIFNINPKGTIGSMEHYMSSGARGHKEYYDRLMNIYEGRLPERNYTGDQIRKGIESNNPPNSRGNLMVYWESGGGHSMAWETDSKGRVQVRDCQTNEMVDIDDLATRCVDVNFMRTDNLQLKKGVLSTVAKN